MKTENEINQLINKVFEEMNYGKQEAVTFNIRTFGLKVAKATEKRVYEEVLKKLSEFGYDVDRYNSKFEQWLEQKLGELK